jgi:hypothetical protein
MASIVEYQDPHVNSNNPTQVGSFIPVGSVST